MDAQLRLAEKDAANGDLVALSRLINLRRKISPVGYDITRPIHNFIVSCVDGRTETYTGHHNHEAFRVRFFYAGELVFAYRDGIIVVTGGYRHSCCGRYAFFIKKLDSTIYNKFRTTKELPEFIRESIRRYDGDTTGIIINVAEHDSFQKLKAIIDLWIP